MKSLEASCFDATLVHFVIKSVVYALVFVYVGANVNIKMIYILLCKFLELNQKFVSCILCMNNV